MTKKVVAFIPARMAASRFPGKPLAPILGLPMIEHVRRRVALAEVVDDVVVATCDQEIMDTVLKAGGRAVMTKPTHERCTDRIAEAADSVDCDVAVIVQGDEPLFMPEVLTDVVKPFLGGGAVHVTNLLSVIGDKRDLQDIDIVKAVLDEKGSVLYFSRAPVPYFRVDASCPMYRQTGVSAFSREFLGIYPTLAPTALEIVESVDFLRIIGHGYPIRGVVCEDRTVGVDRPGDVARVERILREDAVQSAIHRKIAA
jgi:3-deoxy-manno-octulosonate cytidylyltransferase (CMP-KDO synthetase)